MTNKVSINKRLNELQKLAITGFLFGGDNFSEDVIGVSDELSYYELDSRYAITVFLRETPTHTSTSGIGFYVNEKNSTLKVYSNGNVIEVGLTPVLKELLSKAVIEKY